MAQAPAGHHIQTVGVKAIVEDGAKSYAIAGAAQGVGPTGAEGQIRRDIFRQPAFSTKWPNSSPLRSCNTVDKRPIG
jgi:hypothetical protein